MKPEIVTETDEYLVINKPAGMATEPPSNQQTLRDWLIETAKVNASNWDKEDRFGIVHRLDTDTSGVIIWAKTRETQQSLRQVWQGRQVKKTYLALVADVTEPEGVVELAIERDNKNDRQRVSLLPSAKSRPAITDYKRLGRATVGDREVSLIEAHPITGRTHQIRVHLKALGHPIVGDKLYGEKSSDELAKVLGLNRQFLHARELKLPDGTSYVAEMPVELVRPLSKLGLLGKI